MTSSAQRARQTAPRFKHISIDAVKVLYSKRVVAYRPEFTRIGMGTARGRLGSNAAILLGQFLYWTEHGTDPNGWFYKTQEELFEETGLSDEEQLTARNNLKRHGLIEEDLRGVEWADGRRTQGKMHFRVKLEMLRAALERLIEDQPRLASAAEQKRQQKAAQRREKNKQKRQEQEAVSATPRKLVSAINGNIKMTSKDDLCSRQSRELVPSQNGNKFPTSAETDHLIESTSKSTNNRQQQSRPKKWLQEPDVVVVNDQNLHSSPALPATAVIPLQPAAPPIAWPTILERLTKLGLPTEIASRQIEQWPETHMDVAELHQQLRELGVGVARAKIEADADLVRWQLILWPSRPQSQAGHFASEGGQKRGSRAGTLKSAIWGSANSEGDWTPEAGWLDNLLAGQKREQAAKTARMNKEARAAQQAAQEATEHEEKTRLEAEAAKLDQMYEALNEKMRARINEQVSERLGVIGQRGNAEGARLAMRRNLLREMMAQLDDEPLQRAANDR